VASLMAVATRSAAYTFQAPGEALFASRVGMMIPGIDQVVEYGPRHGGPGGQSVLMGKEAPDAEFGAQNWPWTPKALPIYHFGHPSDPIFMGGCRGRWSLCYVAGYGMDTKCHIGYKCMYPHPVNKGTPKKGDYDIKTHVMVEVIKNVLVPHDVPDCQVVKYGPDGCQDCNEWEFL
jgi:putative lipase involved disintegration of autophagic bodies